MPHEPYRALYLHIPFCKRRCRYCDFTTRAVDAADETVAEYVERLLIAIRRAGRAGDLACCETVYIGGGTPSFLGQKHLTEILYMLGVSVNLTAGMEVSMEANPDSLGEALVKDIWALGVNRLSIGVQSFDDTVLAILGRVHDAQAARRAIETARLRFENVSADLMCGIPGQSRDSFLSDVETALDAGVKHISIYPLTVEPGTEMARLVRAGEVPDVDEDAQADMMQDAARLMAARGLRRYEVASYAYPGFECRHNIAYWTGVPYLGLGASAVTMTQNGERRMRKQDGCIIDDLDPRQMLAEDLMLGMRLSEGVSDERMLSAQEAFPEIPSLLGQLEEKGLLEHGRGRWHPTETGWLCGNELYGAFLDLAP